MESESVKLGLSLKSFGEMKDTIDSINTTLKKIDTEALKNVIKDLSTSTSTTEDNCIILPNEEHTSFKCCIEKLCTMRPVLLEYKSVIHKVASLDVDLIFKKITDQVNQLNSEYEELENKQKRLEEVITSIGFESEDSIEEHDMGP